MGSPGNVKATSDFVENKQAAPDVFTENLMALSDLAEALSLDVRRDAEIAFVGKIPTMLNARLVPISRPEHIEELSQHEGIAAVVCPPDLAADVPEHMGCVVHARPLAQAMAIHEHLCDLPDFLWESFPSRIDPTARIAPGAYIHPENVVIGPHCEIGPNAVILERSVLEAHCRIGPCTVVGCEAFEKMPDASPKRMLRQAGGVWLEEHVTVMANTTLIRATFGGFTWVGRECMIDTHIHLAHDVRLGPRVTIIACSEVSGRVEVGEDAYLGPNCTISNGLKIGAGAFVTMGSVVARDVPEGARVTGNFALPHEKWLNFVRTFR